METEAAAMGQLKGCTSVLLVCLTFLTTDTQGDTATEDKDCVYRCLDGTCVNDPDAFCPDMCHPGERRCPNGGCTKSVCSTALVTEETRCKYPCRDGKCLSSPEGLCSDGCLQKERRCGNGQCANASSLCFCAENEYRCDDGATCLPQDMQCDGVKNCTDGSDEEDCSNASRLSYLAILAVAIIPILIGVYCYCQRADRYRSQGDDAGTAAVGKFAAHASSEHTRNGAGTSEPVHQSDEMALKPVAGKKQTLPVLNCNRSANEIPIITVDTGTPLLPPDDNPQGLLGPPPKYSDVVDDSHKQLKKYAPPSYDAVEQV